MWSPGASLYWAEVYHRHRSFSLKSLSQKGILAGKEGGIEKAVGFAKLPWPEGLEQAME